VTRSQRNVLLFILLGLAITLVHPQESKKKEPEEPESKSPVYRVPKADQMTITATPRPQALKDCSSSVEVVDREDIALSSAASALGILDRQSGIFISRTGDFGRADVNIRGLGNNCRQIAVLVDGKPEKMGLFGCAVSHTFPLDNVERIEVIKGPASVLYGGEALGGVVNIITRMPDRQNETDLSFSLGGFKTRLLNAYQGGRFGKLRYSLSVDRRSSEGHIPNSQYDGLALTTGLQIDISEGNSLRAQAKYFSGNKHEPGPVDQPVEGLWNDYRRGAVDLTYTGQGPRGDLNLKLFHNFGNHEFSDGWQSTDYTCGLMARYTTEIFSSHHLTLGGEGKMFGGESFHWPVGKWDKSEGALFVHDSALINDRWVITGGLRLHADSLYGTKWCPQAGSVLHLSDAVSLRVDIKNGFRSPQINELYMYPSANPDLQPEEVWNYELGYRHRLGRAIFLEAGLFVMEGTNLIRTVANPGGIPPFVFANTGRFQFKGLDLAVQSDFNRHLSVGFSYTFIDFGEYTRGKPGQKLNGEIRYRSDRLQAVISGHYVADYYASDQNRDQIPNYCILDTRWIVSLSHRLDLTFDVNNILNSDYRVFGEFPGLTSGLYQMPGRYLQMGLSFSLNTGE